MSQESLNSSKTLLDGVAELFGKDEFTDFSFIVKNRIFKVHRSILAASSVVMQSLFTNDCKEKKTRKSYVNNVEPLVFEALLRFMYTCRIPENVAVYAHELYAAAEYYQVQSLKEICLEEIRSKLSKDTAIKTYYLACKYDLHKLSTAAWNIVKR